MMKKINSINLFYNVYIEYLNIFNFHIYKIIKTCLIKISDNIYISNLKFYDIFQIN